MLLCSFESVPYEIDFLPGRLNYSLGLLLEREALLGDIGGTASRGALPRSGAGRSNFGRRIPHQLRISPFTCVHLPLGMWA